jgi:hypothetical protein
MVQNQASHRDSDAGCDLPRSTIGLSQQQRPGARSEPAAIEVREIVLP